MVKTLIGLTLGANFKSQCKAINKDSKYMLLSLRRLGDKSANVAEKLFKFVMDKFGYEVTYVDINKSPAKTQGKVVKLKDFTKYKSFINYDDLA